MVAYASRCSKCGMEIWLDGQHKCDGMGFDDAPQPRPKHKTITPAPLRNVIRKIPDIEVKKLCLQEGDIVVIISKEQLYQEHIVQLRDSMTEFLKQEGINNKVLVMDRLELEVLRKE